MKIKSITKTLFCIGLLALTSCTGGVVKTSVEAGTQSATIKGLPGWNPLSVIAVQIYQIDSRKYQKPRSKYELSAGKHKIKVRCSREKPERVQRYYTFDLYLKAGHVYKPKLDMTKDCYLSYIDATTGKKFIGVED